jgi:lysophospholipase L1-like esterase
MYIVGYTTPMHEATPSVPVPPVLSRPRTEKRDAHRVRSNKRFLLLVGSLLIIFGIVSVRNDKTNFESSGIVAIVSPQSPTPTSSPTPTEYLPFGTYSAPQIATKSAYTIVMVGDSMTAALGPHGGTFNEFINRLYKQGDKGILVDNYAVGGKSILQLMEMMQTKTTFWDSTFEPLLSRDFDLILIESFGYNPLSQFPLEEGLKKHNEMLDEAMKTLVAKRPHSAVVFVATIAPSKRYYATVTNPLQAEERMTYIRNHIAYAESHAIPLVNVFEKSLKADGDGKLAYINPNDYIHPSFAGVDFIGHEIADYIYGNNILPR